MILVIGIFLLVSMSCYTGLLIYATFHDCDPVSARVITKSDQLLPFYVMELAGAVPGLPGIFMSGVFSAALRCGAGAARPALCPSLSTVHRACTPSGTR